MNSTDMTINMANLSEDHILVGLRWFIKMTACDRWDLNHGEAATLLNIEESKYVDILCNADAVIGFSAETVERLSILISIWKRSVLWAPTGREDIALLAFKKRGGFVELAGKSIKDHLLVSRCVENFYEVERILRL